MLVILVGILATTCQAITWQEILDVIAAGPYKDDYTVIEKLYAPPKWYLDGKFGFYTHWGVYSVPGFGSEWYPRNMYKKGDNENKHQVETYGPLSVTNGYKEFIPNFTGEYFNATEWMDVFHRAGAKFAGPVGEHHDGFAMYNCSISQYNAVNMGPKRDITGQLKAAAAALPDMRFVVSSHRAWHSAFYNGGRDLPESDVYQCKCDGGGKASGDPAYCTLYCPANPDEKTPTEGYMRDWLLRTCEIIDLYSNDVMYFDWWIGVSPLWQPYVKKLAAFFYNKMHKAGKQGVINTKSTTMPKGTDVLDFERGQACTIRKSFWQTDTSISHKSWGFIEGDSYKSPQSIIGNLVDIVSKNGAMLMNVGPAPNGTIPAAAVDTFLSVGNWLQEAGEAVYGTRSYHVFSEGPTLMGCGSFASEEVDFTVEDFRFTSKNNSTVYALAMGAKGGQKLAIKSLGGARAALGKISKVEVLGHGEVPFKVNDDSLRVTLPNSAGSRGPPVVAVHGLSDTQWDSRVRQGADGSLHLTATNTETLAGGAKLDTLGGVTGAISGGVAAIGGLGQANWTLKVRQAGKFRVRIIASSPGGRVRVSVQNGDSKVSDYVEQTKPNEFVVVADTILKVDDAGDVEISVTANNVPTPAPPPSPLHWIADDGKNYYAGCDTDGKTWIDLGKQNSKEACQNDCKASAGCKAWTWHDASQVGYANVCVGRTDGLYKSHAEGGHFSGRLNNTLPTSSCTGGGVSGFQLAALILQPVSAAVQESLLV